MLLFSATFRNGDTYTLTGQLLMRVDQAGDKNPKTVGSSATPPINPVVGGSTPAPAAAPIERTFS